MCSCVHPPTSTLQVSRAGMSSFPLYLPLPLLTRTLASHSPSLNIDGVIFQGCQAQHSNLSETAFQFTEHLMSPRATHTSSFALGIKTDQCPRYALNLLKYTSQIYVHMMCMKATAPASSHPPHAILWNIQDLAALPFPLRHHHRTPGAAQQSLPLNLFSFSN